MDLQQIKEWYKNERNWEPTGKNNLIQFVRVQYRENKINISELRQLLRVLENDKM